MNARKPLCLLLTLALVSTTTAFAGAIEKQKKAPERALPLKLIRGEALLVSKDAELILAIDEADAEGVVDGRVDHILSMLLADLAPYPLSVQDAAAEIELRRSSIRAILPTLGQDLRFRMIQTEEVMEEPRHLGILLKPREFVLGLQLYHYSGKIVQELTLAEVERSGTQILKTLRPVESDPAAIEVSPFKPPADAGPDGSNCKSACSITCGAGTCAATCTANRCAQCSCLSTSVPTPASCYCA